MFKVAFHFWPQKNSVVDTFFMRSPMPIRTFTTGYSAGRCLLFKGTKRLVLWTAILYVHQLTAWARIISFCLFYQTLCSKNRTSFHPLLTTMVPIFPFLIELEYLYIITCCTFHYLCVNGPYFEQKYWTCWHLIGEETWSDDYLTRTAWGSTTAGGNQMKILFKLINSELLAIKDLLACSQWQAYM